MVSFNSNTNFIHRCNSSQRRKSSRPLVPMYIYGDRNNVYIPYPNSIKSFLSVQHIKSEQQKKNHIVNLIPSNLRIYNTGSPAGNFPSRRASSASACSSTRLHIPTRSRRRPELCKALVAVSA